MAGYYKCMKCGKELSPSSAFCPNCGTKVMQVAEDILKEPITDAPLTEIPMEEGLKLLVTEKQEYYIAKWKIMQTANSKVSWNWSAFLFSVAWLAFRKMYPLAFLFSVLLLIEMIIEFETGIPSTVGFAFGILISISFGLFGNYLYLKRSERKLAEVKFTIPDPKMRNRKLKQTGGTSAAGAIVFSLVWGLLVFTLGKSPGIFGSLTGGIDAYNQGVHYQQTGQNDLAEQQFKIAIQQNPNFAEAYLNLGLIYLNTRWFDGAEEMTLKCISILNSTQKTIIEGGSVNQTLSIAYNNLGVARLGRALEAERSYKYDVAKSEWNRAMKFFSEAIRLDPSNAQAQSNVSTYKNAY